jgi:hypothetical protein
MTYWISWHELVYRTLFTVLVQKIKSLKSVIIKLKRHLEYNTCIFHLRCNMQLNLLVRYVGVVVSGKVVRDHSRARPVVSSTKQATPPGGFETGKA